MRIILNCHIALFAFVATQMGNPSSLLLSSTTTTTATTITITTTTTSTTSTRSRTSSTSTSSVQSSSISATSSPLSSSIASNTSTTYSTATSSPSIPPDDFIPENSESKSQVVLIVVFVLAGAVVLSVIIMAAFTFWIKRSDRSKSRLTNALSLPPVASPSGTEFSMPNAQEPGKKMQELDSPSYYNFNPQYVYQDNNGFFFYQVSTLDAITQQESLFTQEVYFATDGKYYAVPADYYKEQTGETLQRAYSKKEMIIQKPFVRKRSFTVPTSISTTPVITINGKGPDSQAGYPPASNVQDPTPNAQDSSPDNLDLAPNAQDQAPNGQDFSSDSQDPGVVVIYSDSSGVSSTLPETAENRASALFKSLNRP